MTDSTAPEHFSASAGPTLSPQDGVAALLILPGERYLMQLRDDRADIFYPGHWGCFGGAMDGGEAPLETLRRELREELELEMPAATEFGKFTFDIEGSPVRFFRLFFEVRISDKVAAGLKLHEGAEMRAFAANELLRGYRVTPYDGFAVWAHSARGRLVAPAA